MAEPKVFGTTLRGNNGGLSTNWEANLYGGVTVYLSQEFGPQRRVTWSLGVKRGNSVETLEAAARQVEENIRQLVEALGPLVGWEPKKG